MARITIKSEEDFKEALSLDTRQRYVLYYEGNPPKKIIVRPIVTSHHIDTFVYEGSITKELVEWIRNNWRGKIIKIEKMEFNEDRGERN